MARVDTRLWDLGAMTFAVGGCGPLVALPSDTDSHDEADDSDDEGRPDTTDSTPTPTSTTPGGCDPACPPGYTCIDGYCQYDCNSCCVGECGGYYECFAHEDCGGGSYCNYYACTNIPYLYNCEPFFTFGTEFIPEVGAALSLAFAAPDFDAGQDLAVAGPDGAWVVRAPDANDVVPVDIFGASTGVAATNIDGASASEFTFALPDDDILVTMQLDPFPQPWSISEPSLDRIVGGDLDGDGLDDVAGIRNGAIGLMFSNGTSFELEEPGFIASSTIAAGDVGPTAGVDLVWTDAFVYVGEVFPGGGSSVMAEERYGFAVRTPIVGDFDGNGLDDLAAIAPDLGGYYGVIATWANTGAGVLVRNPYTVGPQLELSPDGVFANAVGDFNGDGAEDVALGRSDVITILHGVPSGGAAFGCWSEVPVNGFPRSLAAGDFDGNGRDDLAWSDGVTVTRILLSN